MATTPLGRWAILASRDCLAEYLLWIGSTWSPRSISGGIRLLHRLQELSFLVLPTAGPCGHSTVVLASSSKTCLCLSRVVSTRYSSYSNMKGGLSFLPSTSLLTATYNASSLSIIESYASSIMLGQVRWDSGSNPDTLPCFRDLCKMCIGLLCPGKHRQVYRYLWPSCHLPVPLILQDPRSSSRSDLCTLPK